MVGICIYIAARTTMCIFFSLGDVLVRMMEEKDRDTCRTLFGHGGPVYKVGFDPFKTMLLSCSEDSTGITICAIMHFFYIVRPC